MNHDGTIIGIIVMLLTAIFFFIIYIIGIAVVVFVVGYIILWLLRDFGILQHFGINLINLLIM